MRTYVIAAAALVLASTGAYAIEIQNQESREVKVSVFPQDSGPVTFTLKPGEIKRDACPKTICEVMLGTESGEWVATSHMEDKVIVKDNKLMLSR